MLADDHMVRAGDAQVTTRAVDMARCMAVDKDSRGSCILLNFYIKPQPPPGRDAGHDVVSYWISTSNHNLKLVKLLQILVVSYWISTSNHNTLDAKGLLTWVVSYWISTSNHNMKAILRFGLRVVSYWISTSNHNRPRQTENQEKVVSYWISTSNHNRH